MKTASVLTRLSACAALAFASTAVSPLLANASSSTPGITANSVTVGAIVAQSGPVAATFRPYLSGVEAYFDSVNASGGVNGRQINLAHVLDDASLPSNNLAAAHTLVASDHVFAIVGISTGIFAASSYLASPKGTGTPTFGYATGPGWAVAPNFFAAYGSTLNYNVSSPDFAYLAKQFGSKSVGVVSLNYTPSSAECQGGINGLKAAGFKVNYVNLAVPIFGGENYNTDAIKMKAAGVDFVVSCMDSTADLALSRAIRLNGLTTAKQLWFDGYNRDILRANAMDMKNVYILTQHVPFEAANPPQGLRDYFNAMQSFGFTSDEFSDVALQGWMGAHLFVQGLRAAGVNPTQKSLVTALNAIKSDTGGGVAAPVNWAIGHTKNTSPGCDAFVQATNTSTSAPTFAIAFNSWVCFPMTGKVNPFKPVPPPPGTPAF